MGTNNPDAFGQKQSPIKETTLPVFERNADLATLFSIAVYRCPSLAQIFYLRLLRKGFDQPARFVLEKQRTYSQRWTAMDNDKNKRHLVQVSR